MKKNDLLISVLVPVYNARVYLKECIDSVLNQTYKNIEVILVNDGSTDGSKEICDAYAVTDKRVRAIHKENSGVVDTRKVGVTCSTGAYCICIDADDYISSDYIETIVNIIVEYEPDMICCGYVRTNGINNITVPLDYVEGYYNREKIETDIIPYILASADGKSFPQALWAKAIKTDICREMLSVVEHDLKYSEDLCSVVIGLHRCESLYILNKCFYFYRNNPNSVVNKKNGKPWNTIHLIDKTLLKVIDISTLDYKNQIYRRLCMEIFFLIQSHLRSEERYRTVAKEVRQYLQLQYIQDIICKCHFTNSVKWTIVKYLLRYKKHMIKFTI